MRRLLVVSAALLSAQCHPEAIGEFKRMPELRGQSFGLENFLMQPFNLASQAAPAPAQRKRTHTDSYSVEFEVNNEDFDMRRLVPTLPGAAMVFSQSEINHELKPVHEHIEELPPPQRKHHERRRRPPVYDEALEKQTERPLTVPEVHRPDEFKPKLPTRKLPSLEDEIEALVLDGQTSRPIKLKLPSLDDEIQSLVSRPDSRRPLEKPAEFMVSIAQHSDSYPVVDDKQERPRKRVMKRRRKRPSTPHPDVDDEEKIKELEDNSFISLPTSYQETLKDTTAAESIVIEHGQPAKRRPPPGYKHPEVRPSRQQERPSEAGISQDEIIQSASQDVPVAAEVGNVLTTEIPGPAESTQRLKTLLKQQSGQLSLSELLQTQNLSLTDFLKGNPGALSALGGTKVKQDKLTDNVPAFETPKPKERPNIPKISAKSRPFSKPFNGTKPTLRRSTTAAPTTEESVQLPKKLHIIEVTSDKPTYNGFTPKRPRIRMGIKNELKFNNSREKAEEISPYRISTTEKEEIVHTIKEENNNDDEEEEEEEDDNANDDEKREDKKDDEEISENELPAAPTTMKILTLRSTTSHPVHHEVPSSTEPKPTPKRYGEYRPKLKTDRRKPMPESTTETDKPVETTLPVTTESSKSTRTRDRVRIPFMSVNNPEITVILPNKKLITTTEKPRPSPVIKDRINVFKRINSEEKLANENTIESQEKVAENPTSSIAPPEDGEREDDVTGNETSDEIIELLKAGKQAVRLQRILSARNMTVSELVEKRANASRQPNVTKLFERRVSSAEAGSRHKPVHSDDHRHYGVSTSAPLTTKRIIPVFDILSPNYKTDAADKMRVRSEIVKPLETNAFDELFVDESVVRPIKLPIDENREAKSYDSGKEASKSRGSYNLSPGTEGKAHPPMPLWNVAEKTVYGSNPFGYPTYDMNNNLLGRASTTTTTTTTSKPTLEEEDTLIFETIRTDDPNSQLKSSISDILKERIEVTKEIKEDQPVIPPAVKSAIIASGVVMGIALVVFVAIFATCGWKQRQFRLRARSSILNDSIDGSRKAIRRSGTLSPVSFKRSALYKKSIDFDTESSASGSSNTSSYLWNTLKHTFQSRSSTLKNRQEKEEKIQDRENRSRRNTLCREDERPRNNTMSRDEHRRDVDIQMPRRNTLTREDMRRDSLMSRDTLSRDSMLSSRDLVRTESRRSSCMRDDRRANSLARENERCSFRAIDPDRHIIQTSVNFKRGGRDSFDSSRHFDKFDSCDHFN